MARTTSLQLRRTSRAGILVRMYGLRLRSGFMFELGPLKSKLPGTDKCLMQTWNTAGSTNATRPSTMIGQQMERHSARNARGLSMPKPRNSSM